MLTDAEEKLIADFESIGQIGTANSIRRKAVIRLAHQLGLSYLLKEPA